jgi:hypothetical protein
MHIDPTLFARRSSPHRLPRRPVLRAMLPILSIGC